MHDEERDRLESGYRRFGSDLWRAVYGFCGDDPEVADDAVAEAFAQAGRLMGAIRDLRSWIFTAAFRIAAGELKRRATTSGLQSAEGRVAMDAVDRTAGEEAILDLIRQLSPAQRRAFVMREVLGFPSREAARLLRVSEVSVRVHLHAARRRLQKRIQDEERV